MQELNLSVLVPVKNVENNIARILSFAAKQTEGIGAEFIIVDMGSEDQTVLQAVTLVKDLNLHGFVIQNGDSSVPAALNTAIQKAGGKYLTFLFARRLYAGFLKPYLECAERFDADAVIGCVTQEEERAAERRSISHAIRQPDGAHIAKDIFRRKTKADLAAFLVRREFLLSRQIDVDEECAFGYAGEFLLRCILGSEKVTQAPVLLQRDEANELKRGKSKAVGFAVFERVEAALRVLDAARLSYPNDDELRRLAEKDAVPRAVMDCVDVVLREGSGVRSVRQYLSTSGYDRLLSVDGRTDPVLRRRILLWKALPLLYRPE